MQLICPSCELPDDECECEIEELETCPKCSGSRLNWEGGKCEVCDGFGYLDI